MELEEKEWDLMMDMNIKSAFLMSKNVIPQMISSKNGKIVHLSSRSGLKSTDTILLMRHQNQG